MPLASSAPVREFMLSTEIHQRLRFVRLGLDEIFCRQLWAPSGFVSGFDVPVEGTVLSGSSCSEGGYLFVRSVPFGAFLVCFYMLY